MPTPTIQNIRVYSTDRDAITIDWDIASTTEDLSTYTVFVLRSEAEAGPYNIISLPLNAADIYDFNDRGVNQISKWRKFYYRLRLVDSSNNETEFGSVDPARVAKDGVDPGGVSMDIPPDIEALESASRFRLVAEEYAGQRVLFLPLRTSGQRCTNCWDPLKRRVTKSNCRTCFKTGFTGGYLFPREGHIVSVPSGELNALTVLMTLQPNDIVRWVPLSPRLKPGDLMIDVQNRRWQVLSLQLPGKSGATTRQTVQLRELSRDQIEYAIPINWGEDNYSVMPHRQFVRATDIDSYHVAAQDYGFGEVEPNQIDSTFTTNIDEAD